MPKVALAVLVGAVPISRQHDVYAALERLRDEGDRGATYDCLSVPWSDKVLPLKSRPEGERIELVMVADDQRIKESSLMSGYLHKLALALATCRSKPLIMLADEQDLQDFLPMLRARGLTATLRISPLDALRERWTIIDATPA